MGAVTFTRHTGSNADEADGVYRDYKVVRGLLTFSASYATGGDSLALGPVGMSEVRKILIDPSQGFNTSGLSIALGSGSTPTAPVIQAFETNNTEVVNATNLSARTPIPVWLLGKG